MSRTWKAVLGVAAAVIALNVALDEVDDATRGPKGPASSSFATTPRGVAAYAELLERYDHPVVRLRKELGEASLDPATTVVLLDPEQLTDEELEVVKGFVSAGGRLVASGPAVGSLAGDADVITSGSTHVGDRADALPTVDFVKTDGRAWAGIPDARALLEAPDAAFLLEQREGSGRALLLADSSPLQNRLLAEADNAALGIELAGAPRRPVVFVESLHGYGEATGIGAIPGRWWWVLGGLAVAALLYALASGKRFGPPEREHRELPPPRAEFADAIATSLAKTRPRSKAVDTARRVVRERLARAARLPLDSPDDSFRRAAGELGLGGIDAVLDRRSDDAALLELGRLLGELERREARV